MRPSSALAAFSDELADLVAAVVGSVVSLSGTAPDDAGGGSGSGFVIDGDGHVLTNFHVVEGLDPTLDATLPGHRRRRAEVVGVDPLTDLALLRLDRPPAGHLELRTEPARLGEVCLALGSPFGTYPESVSYGVVSGLARTVAQQGRRAIERAIQTDAAVNPGNSGGPLIDARGRVLGVNQCQDTRGMGISFAIPADTAAWVAAELRSEGSVVRAALGVTVALRSVQVDDEEVPRLAVTRVKGTVAGFEVGDVILTIAGQVVDERADLFDFLTKERIDSPTIVEVLRHGQLATLTVTPTRMGDD